MTDDFFDDAAASAKDAADDAGQERLQNWKWNEPKELRCILQEAVIQPLKDGTFKYRLSVLNTEDNEQYTLWMGAPGESPMLLTNQWWDCTPAIGSKVLIQYTGKKKSPDSGYEYGLYQVRAEVSDFAFWDELALKRAQKIKIARESAMEGTASGGTDISEMPDAF